MPSTWRSMSLMVVAKNTSAQIVHRQRRTLGRLPAAATLALDTTAPFPAHQRLDFGDADTIEVAVDGMLEARCSSRELERPLLVAVLAQSVDQTSSKRIAGAHAIDDVRDLVVLAAKEARARRQHGRPAIVVRTMALAERNDLT